MTLSERLEKATGPDVDLSRINRDIDRWARERGIHRSRAMLNYTRSIDAALTLVPEGWRIFDLSDQTKTTRQAWHCGVDQWRGGGVVNSYHRTPAIALCIAALKSQEEPSNE